MSESIEEIMLDSGPKATEDQLSRLAKMAKMVMDLEDRIADCRETLTGMENNLRTISEVHIPGILDETGLSEVRLKDGSKIVVREDLRVSTTGKYRDPINSWLKEIGADDLIKDVVTCQFGRGEDKLASRLVKAAEKLTEAVERKRFVNAQSFAALVREMLSNSEEVPLERVGVTVQKRARVERPQD